MLLLAFRLASRLVYHRSVLPKELPESARSLSCLPRRRAEWLHLARRSISPRPRVLRRRLKGMCAYERDSNRTVTRRTFEERMEGASKPGDDIS